MDQSVALRLIPAPQALILAGDGSSLRTGNSPAGVKVCNCKEQGIHRCSCPRRYPDPDTTWGWDSYREVYYYGYSLYELTAADSPSELPLFISLFQAVRHDSVMAVVALAQFRELYPLLTVAKALWDSAHDAYDFYRLHHAWQMEPFIDLSSAWKEICDKRSAVERSFKRAKIDYELERCRVRSKQAWFWRSHLVGMNQHLDAWVNNAAQNGFDSGRWLWASPWLLRAR